MWAVEYRDQNSSSDDPVCLRIVDSQEAALALSAHLIIRACAVLCIRERGRLAMTADQIYEALDNVGNDPPMPGGLRLGEDARPADGADRTVTFERVAREWLENKKPEWTPYYARQVERSLELHVLPHIGTLSITDVSTTHLRSVFGPIKQRDTKSVVSNLRYWCLAIFRHAMRTQRVTSNPAAALDLRSL